MSQFDFRQPPFDVLNHQERQELNQQADIIFFAQGSNVLDLGQDVHALYVVIKGIIREMHGEETMGIFRALDTFDTRALISGHAHSRFVVHEEALVFAIPRDLILRLIDQNPVFGAFFYQSAAQKFSTLAQQRSANRELQTLLASQISDIASHIPVFLDANETVLDAAKAMKQQRVKSILVRDGDRVGIFTTSDFRDVLLAGHEAHTKLGAISRFELITCDIHDYLFNALLTMTRHTVQRVVVTENGKPIGILEQIDLLSYFSNHSHLITQQLERAESLDALKSIAGQIDKLIQILSSHGVKASQLAELVQTLNAQLFARTWQLIVPAVVLQNSCLLVMGSEGRGEQILKTDQDNALIIRDDFSHPDLATFAQQFSDALASFGYPPCPGQVMISQADWRRSVSDWKDTLYRWINLPVHDSQMNLAIFVDAHVVAGDETLFHDVRDNLQRNLDDSDAFYQRFAQAVLQFDTPLGLFGQLLSHEENGISTLDLKKGGIFPLVHGVRALALRHGLEMTNTFARLDALAQREILDKQLAHDVDEALAFLLNLRLKTGLERLTLGEPINNLIEPKHLSTLERDLLKEAFGVVKRFKASIRHAFRLGGF